MQLNSLPQCASVRGFETGELKVQLMREIKGQQARRKVEYVPRYRLTINWADCAPGISWPVAYWLTCGSSVLLIWGCTTHDVVGH